MDPSFPIYVVSKGRYDSRLTVKALQRMRVPYHVVIEQQEFEEYAAVIPEANLLVLDTAYQDAYDTCDKLGSAKSKGPGPARNFAWEHSIKAGYAWHWVMDDNIRSFMRFNHNRQIQVLDGAFFVVMEDFCIRYRNLAMAGPNYDSFVKSRFKIPPLTFNTRIYSCNLIRNDVPFRWRGRYNEDTDLSLCMLKKGWCTVQFNGFLQQKLATQTIKGGNTKEFYAHEGTVPKSQMIVDLHPDVAKLKFKFNRPHHHVNYSVFKNTNKLIYTDEYKRLERVNEFGMEHVKLLRE